jgi:uncharacterized protein (TIGR03437 family)
VSLGIIYAGGDTDGVLPGQTTLGGRDSFVTRLEVPPATGPEVNDGGVVNNGSFAQHPAPLAPGSIAAIFGKNLNDGSTVLFSAFGPDDRLVKTLGGSSVKFNDIPAPMFYSTPEQLGVQVPFELAGQTSATVVVESGGRTSAPRTVFLDAASPGIFTTNQDGRGSAAVLHEDGVVPVSADNPARPNEVLTFFATALGATNPPLQTGERSAGNRTAAEATVTIDGVPAVVEFSGTAPDFVGLNQINVRVPSGTRSGPDIPVVLTMGTKQSNTVTIAVAP